jgi:methionyl-tRNA formyltransferase
VSDTLRYAFYGSGRFAARCLDLLARWSPPSWVVTAPPREAGRGRKLSATPVAAFVSAHLAGTPLIESAAASSDERVWALKTERPVDLSFVIDFGQVMREPVLEWESRVGCLNIHPSLLPKYRGAAPVQRALMDGAVVAGVTIFKLAKGMDSGPVLLQTPVPIEPEDDAEALLLRSACVGVEAFIEFASDTPIEEWRFYEQDESAATYAPKISPEEERIDWCAAAGDIVNKIRALSPRPGAWTTVRDRRLRVMSAQLTEEGPEVRDPRPGEIFAWAKSNLFGSGFGAVRLVAVQPEGKKIQRAAQWWNGFRATGEEFFV